MTINQNSSIEQAMLKINFNEQQIVFVTDNNGELIGSLSDGDIRRAILSGATLDQSILAYMNREPHFIFYDSNQDYVSRMVNRLGIRILPILDSDRKIIDFFNQRKNSENTSLDLEAVILAGGLGTRISEETENKPKPMIEIGGMPILWHIMKIYSNYGYNDFVVCLGYKGYVIKEYFANYFLHKSDVTIDLKNNSIKVHEEEERIKQYD